MKKVRSFLCVVIALSLFAASFPIADFAIDTSAASEQYLWPVDGVFSMSRGFYSGHSGIDIWNSTIAEKEVRATKSGTIEISMNNCPHTSIGNNRCSCNGGCGNYVQIKHTDGTVSRYLHLKQYTAHSKGYVNQGDVIGNVWSSGDSSGYHLHFDIWENGVRINSNPIDGRHSYSGSHDIGNIYYIYDISVPTPDAQKLIKSSYPSHCTIKVTENDKNIMSLPCSNKTNSKSDKVESAPKGTTYEAIGLILNTEDNLWYKVKAKNGKEGYIFAGNVSFVSAITSDITGPGISVPSNHTHGKTYILTGSVNSSYNELTNVSAYVYSGSNKITGGTASVNGKSYSLGRSTIDNQTEFNKLAVGQYTYKVTASYKSYYAKTDKAYGTKTGTVNVYSQAFNVVSGSVSPTVPQQPTTIIYPNNEGIYKIASGVGNNMYLDFACTNDNVQIYENCDGHSNSAFVTSQYFKLTHIGDGWYSIINIGNGKAMDVYCANSKPETNIHQWEYDGNNAQLFRFYDAGNGYCYIQSKLGCYADVQNGDCVNNANVWTYIFNGSNAQKWKLEHHVHSYDSHYEADHPHRVYKKCKCGDWYYTGDTQTVYSCSACLPEELTTEISNDTNSVSNPVPTIRKGDVDGDGQITSVDARLTLRASVGLENLSNDLIKRSDVDKDNTVSAADARLILRASVKLEDPLYW